MRYHSFQSIEEEFIREYCVSPISAEADNGIGYLSARVLSNTILTIT